MDKDIDLDKDLDMDKDLDSDSEGEKDSDSDADEGVNISKADALSPNAEFVPSYTLEQIELIAEAIDKESDGEYPYVSRLVEKFYEINNARNWNGTDGKPIADIVRWYKQYLDYEMENGYQLKSVSICEE